MAYPEEDGMEHTGGRAETGKKRGKREGKKEAEFFLDAKTFYGIILPYVT